ncbi:MAG: hypothetical protein JSW17_04940 [Candidatus Omnitrophota bacterium]|nr:MAG: hypothetical protein JSW17_04940 [Candidatus Omnitrophota bacterium]
MRKICLILLIFVAFFSCGCHSVRRKFVRKKRVEREVPVYVDFKEYPEVPSTDAYINYYLYVRGWLDELLGALDKGTSYKRKRRAIDETLMNLEQIMVFLSDDGRERIYPIYNGFVEVAEDIKKNRTMSENKANTLIKKIERLKREFEKDFNYVDAEKWML